MGDVSFLFAGETLQPLPCGALFWPARSVLLVADLHLEKGSSFARAGWLLPPHDSLDTLRKLADAVQSTGARRVVALGDSFHDTGGPGRLLPAARALLESLMAAVEWTWVVGNHDGSSADALGGQTVAELALDGIALRHEALPHISGAEISGHYHPKVLLELRTGRRVSRRCFAQTADRLVLPAYGAYAGGLFLDDPALVHALGARPDALLALPEGLVRLTAKAREKAA
jgi:DNA ligase-associated metallophosphoesterase